MSQAFRSKEDAAAMLQMLRLAMAARLDEAAEQGASAQYISALGQQMSEQTDTVLRALYLCNNPSVDSLLSEFADAHRHETLHRFHNERRAAEEKLASRGKQAGGHSGASSGSHVDAGDADADVDADGEEDDDDVSRYAFSDERLEDMLALATSLLPPPPAGATGRIRADPRHWPVPAFNITAFEQHIAKQQFSLYGCSRYLFMHTHAAHRLSKRNAASFAVFSPHLATVVTKSLVDGYWAWFYATGTGSALSKIADVGTLYLPFFGEYGDFPVASYGQEPGTRMDLGFQPSADGKGKGDPVSRVVPEWEADFDEDPLGHMNFECGRYALHTLLKNAGLHAHAGQVFLHEGQLMADRAALMDPFTRADKLGVAGEQRLEIVRMLAPTVAILHERAKQYGIGSGIWPEAYNSAPKPSSALAVEGSESSTGRVAAIGDGSAGWGSGSGGAPAQGVAAAPAQASIDIAAATRAALRDMTSKSAAARAAAAESPAAAAAQAVAAASSASSRMEASRHARELDDFWRRRRPFDL